MEIRITRMLARLFLSAAAGALAAGLVPAVAATHGVTQKANLSIQQARQIALRAYPGGIIVKEELEHEGGGSGLRYSFDMKQDRSLREVGVDAVTGKVLENRAEGPNAKD
jgi:uncharacterized membrane protein YkoI